MAIEPPFITPQSRLERIRAILNSALTSAQKCIGIAIVAHVDDTTGAATLNTTQMRRFASAKDDDTVFRASVALEAEKVVEVTRARGKPNTYRLIPAAVLVAIEDAYRAHTSARQSTPVQPEHLAKSTPVKGEWWKEEDSGSTGPPGPDHPGSTGAVLARARDLVCLSNNIYPQTQSLEAAREGEESLGEGVFVNCRTVRHRAFTVSLESVVMQLRTHGMPKDKAEELARASAVANALQWATEINGGKPSGLVVPSNPANFIRGSILRQYGTQPAVSTKPTQAEVDALHESLERRRLADVERAAHARKRH